MYKRLFTNNPFLTQAVIEQMNHFVEANSMIIADTSEPRLIEALQQKGLNVHKADKGDDAEVGGLLV